MTNINCIICGDELMGHQRKYCSKECNNVVNLQISKELRDIDIELHRCTVCHEDLDSLTHRLCSKCRLHSQEYDKLHKNKHKKHKKHSIEMKGGNK